MKLWWHLEYGFKMPQFQLYLVKMDVFLHGAFNGIVPPDLLLPDGVLPGPVHPQAKEVVALSH